MMEVISADEAKTVKKPWGYEKWLSLEPYVFKILHVKAPYKMSLQFHEKKRETILLVEGHAVLHYHDEDIDLERYAKGKYSNEEIEKIISEVKTKEIGPGTLINVHPGQIHRLEAVDEDITFHEASTTELKDVIRIQDDTDRDSGHIDSEHN